MLSASGVVVDEFPVSVDVSFPLIESSLLRFGPCLRNATGLIYIQKTEVVKRKWIVGKNGSHSENVKSSQRRIDNRSTSVVSSK